MRPLFKEWLLIDIMVLNEKKVVLIVNEMLHLKILK